jgi:hypothetical protein
VECVESIDVVKRDQHYIEQKLHESSPLHNNLGRNFS